jgi:uncharacterized protein YndB with AHSA1/START domain
MGGTIKHGISTDKSIDKVFEVLKDPNNIPKWSSLIKSVSKNSDGTYEGTSPAGGFTFSWDCDDDKKECTMSMNYMGQKYKAILSVFEDDSGTTFISQEVPDTGLVSSDQVKMDIEFGLRKLIKLTA